MKDSLTTTEQNALKWVLVEPVLREYLVEMDNDVAPDYSYRRSLRDRLRTQLGMPR